MTGFIVAFLEHSGNVPKTARPLIHLTAPTTKMAHSPTPRSVDNITSPTDTLSASPLSLPCFNYDSMLDRFMGDTRLATHILEIFLRETPAQLELLENHIQSKNIKGCCFQAHKLAGSSSNVNAERFSRIARHMEDRCRQGHPSNLQEDLANLLQEYQRVEQEIFSRLQHTA